MKPRRDDSQVSIGPTQNLIIHNAHDAAAAEILQLKFSNPRLVLLGTENANEVELSNLVLVGGPSANPYVRQYWPEITGCDHLTYGRYFIDSKARGNGTKVTVVFGSVAEDTLAVAQSYPNLPPPPLSTIEVLPINNPAGLLVPPESLQVQSTGPTTVENFLAAGYVVAEGIRSALRLVGQDLYALDQSSILDFGCGCARVLRWFYDLPASCRLYGVDISRKAIDWCKEAIPFAKFEANEPLPPLGFSEESFDIIYGISVFAHLDEEYQFAWLRELQRVAKPGSIVMLTVHGDYIARRDLADDYAKFHEKGFLYKRVVENGGADGLPDFYQATYHTRRYVEQTWSKYFKILAYLRHGPSGYQDLVVMQRGGLRTKASNWTDAKYIYIDMPITWVYSPKLGEQVRRDEMLVKGWSFHPYPDATTCYLDIWIDGERVDSCLMNQPTPDIAQYYRVFPSASLSGFSRVLTISDLKEGKHVLEVTEATNIISLHRRFFFKGEPRTMKF